MVSTEALGNVICLPESHRLGLNACWINSRYVLARPMPPGYRKLESRLSCGCTSCFARAGRPSIFLPTLGQERPSKDISNLLSGGPTACEASEANLKSTFRLTTSPALFRTRIVASGSVWPNEVTPLK